MHPRPTDLPEFENPPVIEVVIGAQFANLEREMSSAHIGRFWERLHGDYPTAQDAPPLARLYETQGPGRSQTLLLNAPPIRRTWLVSADKNWLVQLQADRLLHNWRAMSKRDVYPRFEECHRRFNDAWTRFGTFCDDHKLGRPNADQLEVTYINHVPVGQGWTSLEDLGSVFPDVGWRASERYLGKPESVSFHASFALDGAPGRLHVSIKHGLRAGEPPEEMLICEITARGLPEAPMSLRDWFFQGRCAIVRAFADLTGDAVHELWGRKG